MSASPRPRSKPRASLGDVSAQPPPQDTTPPDIFIRVYAAKLRALIQEYGLTRAQVGALLILALRMDQDNLCYPGRRRVTKDVSYSDERWTAIMLRKLEAKGVITINRSVDQSHTYHLPDSFAFGGKSQQGGVGISHNPNGGNPHPNNIPASETISSKNEESSTLKKVLISAGVTPREAILISNQYPSTLIQQVISEAAAKAAQISNPGGWIRKTLEIRTGQKLAYSSTAGEQEHEHVAGQPARKPHRPW